MEVIFFPTSSDLRQWFEAHHDQAQELWIGFYKKNAPISGITYAEALDEALCFGWIDGVRKSVDDNSYTNRFSPRKAHSRWSLVNINRVEQLIQLGRMHPAGLKAFEQHDLAKAKQHSYERNEQPLDESYIAIFQANPPAWSYLQGQSPSYRQSATWWVMSAKQEATRLKRLAAVIDASAKGERLPQLRGKTKDRP
jgi:uncharacterized protein YdeI (YjbR/CyaY-like superfamily)